VRHGLHTLRTRGIECTLVRAPPGGAATGPNPTDRGKPGVELSIVLDQRGPPLAIHLDKANRHDIRLLGPTLPKLALEVLQRLALNPELVADKDCDDEHVRAQPGDSGGASCPVGGTTARPPSATGGFGPSPNGRTVGSRRFAPSGSVGHAAETASSHNLLLAPSAILLRALPRLYLVQMT